VRRVVQRKLVEINVTSADDEFLLDLALLLLSKAPRMSLESTLTRPFAP